MYIYIYIIIYTPRCPYTGSETLGLIANRITARRSDVSQSCAGEGQHLPKAHLGDPSQAIQKNTTKS